jgi:phage tail-like protein
VLSVPRFLHLTGRAMWRRCDHRATRIEGRPARVTLATAASLLPDDAPATDLAPWRAAMGSAARIACPPDLCDGEAVVLADPARGLLVLRAGAWQPLPLPAPRAAAPAGTLDFAPSAAPAPAAPPRAIAAATRGRLWLLDAEALRLLGPDLGVSARLPLPGAPFAVAAASWGVLVADGAAPRVLTQADGGEWRGFALPGAPLALAADPGFALAVALLEGERIAVFQGAGPPAIHPLPALRAPLHLLVTGEDRFLVADIGGAPGAPLPTFLTAFRLGPEGPEAEEAYAVRGFDGRALWRDAEGQVFASTPTGARPLYLREPRFATEGQVESFALDSGVFACVWHRVFLDACVPPGTEIVVEARTTDTLPPFALRRPPEPPADVAAAPALEPAWPPLGTLVQGETIGWSPVGLLDRRAGFADAPHPPFAAARPSEDPLHAARGDATPPPAAMVTLEGLVKAPPGRWLFLRLTLRGTERRAPAVFALRATLPRPSLLDLLPAYWRGDPVAGEAMDRALALFEGFTTETDERITALRHLLGSATTPPEALEWLASFLALSFDSRVAEPVRRTLLAEIATLWRRRGTLPGLARLLSILAEAPVQIIEGYRLRRGGAAVLGSGAWGVLGPGLALGADDGPDSEPAEDWEAALALKHAALTARRAGRRAKNEPLCPPADPPEPLGGDALIRLARRHAHRFTVIVPARRSADLEAVLELATETHKPAHTIHALCWLDAGFRLGQGSLVGIARIGPRPGFQPAVLDAPLGGGRTLGRFLPEDRWRVGARRMQQGLRP